MRPCHASALAELANRARNQYTALEGMTSGHENHLGGRPRRPRWKDVGLTAEEQAKHSGGAGVCRSTARR